MTDNTVMIDKKNSISKIYEKIEVIAITLFNSDLKEYVPSKKKFIGPFFEFLSNFKIVSMCPISLSLQNFYD
jgi:hypothetical protein